MDREYFQSIRSAVSDFGLSQRLEKGGKCHETNRLHYSDEHILMCLC